MSGVAGRLTTAFIIKKLALNVGVEMPVFVPNSNRVELAKLFHDLDYHKGAEIGTARGSYAITMSINNPGCKIYCIDAWSIYDGCHDFTDQLKLNDFYHAAKIRLKPYPNVEIINKFSMDAVKDFEDNSLDFVYIDANHEFPYVAEDIFYWEKKVRPGGIVSGHDYLKVTRSDGLVHVREVVDAYTKAFNINPWFVVDEGTLDRAGSFFWVKQ